MNKGRGGSTLSCEFLEKMINAIIYFHVSSTANVFLHRSNKVKKQNKKHAHRRNDVWNTSEMLSMLGGCPSLNPSPASTFGLFTTRHKRKFKEKETPISSQMQTESKKHFLFCNLRHGNWRKKKKKKP